MATRFARVKARGALPLLSRRALDDLFSLASRLVLATGDVRVSLFVMPKEPGNEDSLGYVVVSYTDQHGAACSVRYFSPDDK